MPTNGRKAMSTPSWTGGDDGTSELELESRMGTYIEKLPAYDSATNNALIADLGADGTSMWRGLVDSFLRDGSRLMAITAAADDCNAEALVFAAHALKSSSATLGLLALSSSADQLEMAFQVAPESFDVVGEAVKLVTQYRRATEALRLAREAEGAEGFEATE
jgi:HPt (histidine-containing phosphotransfer) domain-containing protein